MAYDPVVFQNVLASLQGVDLSGGLRDQHEAEQLALAERAGDAPAPASLAAHRVSDKGVSAAFGRTLAENRNRSIAADEQEAAARGMSVAEFKAWKANNLSASPIRATPGADGTMQVSNVDLGVLPPGQPPAKPADVVLGEQQIPFTPSKKAESGGPKSAGTGKSGGGSSGATTGETAGWGFGSGALKESADVAKSGGVSQQNIDEAKRAAEPTLMEQRAAINKRIQDAATGAVREESSGAAEEAATWGDYQRRIAEEDAGWQKTQARFQAEAQRMYAEADSLRQEVKKAELDKRSYLERNPFSGIALAIGAALGGALSARTGGPNQGLMALERSIDRDIDLQKYDIEKKRGDLAAADNLLGRNLKIFGDMQTARAATRYQMKEAVLARLEGIRSSTRSKVFKENADLLHANLEQQANSEALQVQAMNEQRMMMLAASQHGSAQSPEGQMHELDLEKWSPPLELGNGPEGTKLGVILPKGASSDEIKKQIAVAKGLDTDLVQLQQLSAKLKDTLNPVEKARLAAEIRGKLADITQERVAAKGGGAAAEYEVRNLAQSLGDPADWFDVTGGKTAALNAAIERDRRNLYKSVIGAPVVMYKFGENPNQIMARGVGAFSQARRPQISFTEKR